MSLVNIHVSNQRGYVWDMQDVQTIRVHHHICGVLSGTLPQVGQQNVFLGLPLILLPEEVVLLVKNNLAVIVDDAQAHQPPTLEQSETYHGHREAAIEAQRRETRRYDEERKAQMAELYKDKIGKKREGKKKAVEQHGTAATSFEVHVPDLAPGAATTNPPAAVPKPPTSVPLSSIPYTIIIQPSSTDMSWHDPSAASYTTLAAAKEAGVWNYPTTPLQESRCRVFEDLWSKGFFMGGGLRFGGDFLVYPGDPLRYHSHFTLTVLSYPTSSIMPLDLVAYGRLATAVKKAHLLASWDEKAGQVDYLSLEWAAFG